MPTPSAIATVVYDPLSASFTFTTIENTSSVINYGLTNVYGLSQTSGTTTMNHTTSLTGLDFCQVYHYRAVITDIAGNVYISDSDSTFQTNCIVIGSTGGGGI